MSAEDKVIGEVVKFQARVARLSKAKVARSPAAQIQRSFEASVVQCMHVPEF